jgi:hypothetical protein
MKPNNNTLKHGTNYIAAWGGGVFITKLNYQQKKLQYTY